MFFKLALPLRSTALITANLFEMLYGERKRNFVNTGSSPFEFEFLPKGVIVKKEIRRPTLRWYKVFFIAHSGNDIYRESARN